MLYTIYTNKKQSNITIKEDYTYGKKLVNNENEFIQLCKHWREVEGYKNIQEYDIGHPSEYPCIVMIEEQLSNYGTDWCNFHYVYKSDFDVIF